MSLARNSLANLIGGIVPLAITLITVPIYLDLIGVERYGILAVVWLIFGYFGFFDLGIGIATAQRMAKLGGALESDRSKLLWTSLILTLFLGVIGGVILWGIADKLLLYITDLDESTLNEALPAMLWLMPALPILLISSVLYGSLQGRERFIEINVIRVIGSTLIQIFPLFMALWGYVGLEYLVPAALLGRLLTGILLLYQCKVYVPLSSTITFEFNEAKQLVKYGGLISIINVIAPFLVFVDRLVIASLAGIKAVTFYTVPYNLGTHAMKFSGSLASALFPRFSAKPDDARELANLSTNILAAVMTPIIISGIVLFKPFLTIWLGDDFSHRAAYVGEIILIGVWINCLVVPHVVRMQAEGNLKPILAAYVIQIPIYFTMLWLGIKLWGIQGAAAAWTLRVALDTSILLWISDSFNVTISGKVFPFSLILMAFLISLYTDSHILWSWFGLSLIFVVSIISEWSNMLLVIRKVLSKVDTVL